MMDNAALVARLCRVVEASRLVDARHGRAVALFDAHKAQLYRHLDIDTSTRPTSTTKLVADCVLNDLRLRILRAELATAGQPAALLMTVRHRVDMSRRALAAHMTRDDGAALPIVGFYEWPGRRTAAAATPARPRQRTAAPVVADVARHVGHAKPAAASDIAQRRAQLHLLRALARVHDRELICRAMGAIGRSIAVLTRNADQHHHDTAPGVVCSLPQHHALRTTWSNPAARTPIRS